MSRFVFDGILKYWLQRKVLYVLGSTSEIRNVSEKFLLSNDVRTTFSLVYVLFKLDLTFPF